MRSRTIKIFIVLISIVFFADDVDADVVLAPLLNTIFHTSFHAINRDLVENGSNRQKFGASTRTIASASITAVDEDSPTTLETYFPSVKLDTPAPKTKVEATSPGTVNISYLTLHTLLI